MRSTIGRLLLAVCIAGRDTGGPRRRSARSLCRPFRPTAPPRPPRRAPTACSAASTVEDGEYPFQVALLKTEGLSEDAEEPVRFTVLRWAAR